ncbi:MAG: CidA/LrgA family protein [Oscillibacter sp.]|nr:CidA/LrgA family protein [Oscillibacter sp.]
MKIISQLGIIFGIYWLSQIIEALLPFSFPASVIGILLLLALLIPGILKTESIREAADFLTGNLTFFLLPVCSSIMNYVDIIGANLVPFFVICTVSTFVTFFVVYFTVRAVTRMMNKKGGGEA